jgi:hypothetical protein
MMYGQNPLLVLTQKQGQVLMNRLDSRGGARPTWRAVADRLGLPPATAFIHAARALRRLRRHGFDIRDLQRSVGMYVNRDVPAAKPDGRKGSRGKRRPHRKEARRGHDRGRDKAEESRAVA